jgi:hypothetical protein
LVEQYTGVGDGNISGNSTYLKQVTGLINNWYGIVVSDILDADGRWQFDDTNHTKEPVATFDLVSGQAKYNFTLDEQSNQILRLGYVSVKDSAGNWINLKPIDQTDIRSQAYDEFMETSGQPMYFDISDGVGVKLFPAPNYNSTGGGKVYFQREPSYFASTDTTKKAGFAGPYHIILAMGAAYDWGLGKNKANVANLRQEIEQRREEVRAFYSRRNKFEQPKLRAKYRYSR